MPRIIYESSEFYALIADWTADLPEIAKKDETADMLKLQAITAWLILVPVAGTA